MDKLTVREATAPAPDRETAAGRDCGVSPLPEGPVPIGSLIFADELPDGVVVADETSRIIVFNRAAGRLTGLDPAEVTGKFVFDVLPLHDDDGRDWWLYADPYHGLLTRTRHPERSLYLVDGTEVLVSVGYVRDRSKEVRRLVISLRDAQARARLERSRAELVSTVAHELRSPLTSVKGFTATLLNKWGRFTDDQKRVMLETVNADADRVTRLITELLDVSRIESGRMEVHRQLVDLPERARADHRGPGRGRRSRRPLPAGCPPWLARDLAGHRQNRPDPRQSGGKCRPSWRWYRNDRGGTSAFGRRGGRFACRAEPGARRGCAGRTGSGRGHLA